MDLYREIKRKLKQNNTILNTYRVVVKNIILFLKVLMNIIGYIFIVPFALLLPKKNQVLLASRFGDFEGNLKYLFLALNDLEEEEIEFIFLTGKKVIMNKLVKKGYRVWKYPNPSTLIRLLQVRVLIVDGNEWASGFKYFFLYGAKSVQIWHGTGLKAIGLLKPNYQALGPIHKFFRKESTRYDLLSLSSQDQVKTRGAAFHYEHLLINGLPRNDVFFKKEVLQRSLEFEGESLKEYEEYKRQGYKLITYTPTWRKYQEEFYQLDLDRLEAFGGRYQVKWVIKLHYKHDIKLDTTGYRHVLEYEKTADIYPLLAKTDLLITDYSSIYLDFLLLDKPILFYPYDEEEYITGERALLLDYDKVTPGHRVYNQEDLERKILGFLTHGEDPYRESRETLRKQFFEYRDGDATERLWATIKEKLLS